MYLSTLFIDGSFWFQKRLIKEANFSLMSLETKQSSELISWNIVLMDSLKKMDNELWDYLYEMDVRTLKGIHAT